MRLFAYEWKKLWRRKAVWIALLLLSAVNIYKISATYQAGSGAAETAAQRAAYDTIGARISGSLTAENTNFIIENTQRLEALVKQQVKGSAADTYTGSDAEDYFLFLSFYNALQYDYNYPDTISAVVKRAEENAAFYDARGNTYDARNNRQIARLYTGRSVDAYANTDAFVSFIDYDFSALLVLLVLLLGLAPVFCGEKETEMDALLATARRGRMPTIWAKIAAALCFTATVWLWFTAMDAVGFGVRFGYHGGLLPLYTISDYEYTPVSMSILAFACLLAFYRLLGFLLAGGAVLLLSALFADSLPPFVLGAGYIALAVASNDFLTGNAAGVVYYLNPVTLMTAHSLFTTYSSVAVLGYPVLQLLAVPAAAVLLTALLLLLAGFCARRDVRASIRPLRALRRVWKGAAA